jgi:hypothetical protein
MESSLTAASVFTVVTGGERQVGLAVLEPRARAGRADKKAARLTLYQFSDARLAVLESLLVRHAPEHVYGCDAAAGGASEASALARLCASLGDGGVPLEAVPKAKFAEADVAAALAKLAGDDVAAAPGAEEAAAPAAAAAASSSSAAALVSPPAAARVPEGEEVRLAWQRRRYAPTSARARACAPSAARMRARHPPASPLLSRSRGWRARRRRA